jgi:Protein of unknown function (DUF1573)
MNASSETSRLNQLVVCVTLPGTLVLAIATFSILGSSTPNLTPPPENLASSVGPHFPLKINPDPVSLGVIDRGQKAKAAFTLVNHGSQPVAIERIETSCPCLTTTPGSIRVSPGERMVLAVEFDPSAEPDFRGGLSIDVTGYSGDRVAFHTLVNLDVRADSLKGGGALVSLPDKEGHP